MNYQRRRVNFRPDVEVIPISSPLDKVDASAWLELFYQSSALDTFREETREQSRRLRNVLQQALEEDTPLSSSDCDYCIRGLEHRLCFERQRRKCMARKIIVKLQSQVNRERLAETAQLMSAWARALAIEDACREYLRSYTSTKKHALGYSDNDECARCVRQRLS